MLLYWYLIWYKLSGEIIMETEKFLTQVQKVISIVAGIIGMFSIVITIYVLNNNVDLQETINIRTIFPFILMSIIIIFLIFGYFLQKKDP